MPHSEAAILKVLRLKSATANHSGFPGTFVAESEAERSIVAALLRTRRTTRDGGLGGHRCSHCRVPVQMKASPQANRRPSPFVSKTHAHCCCYQEVQKILQQVQSPHRKRGVKAAQIAWRSLGTERSGRLTDWPKS